MLPVRAGGDGVTGSDGVPRHDPVPGWDPMPGHDAATVQLAITDSPDAAGSGMPPRRRRRAENREPRRRIPWFWLAGGLVVLALVGRGLIGAATGQDGENTSAAPATPEPTGTAPVLVQPDPSTDVGGPTFTAVPTAEPIPPPTEDRVTRPLATETATTSVTASPSTSSRAAAVRCSVGVSTAVFWGGYNAEVTVTNTGRGEVNGWLLTFSLPRGQRLTSGWNATYTADQQGVVRASDAGHNARLAPGASVRIGYQAQFGWGGPGGPGGRSGPGDGYGPFGFALNGAACS